MQSDERVTAIYEQLAAQRDIFRSAVADAVEQLRGIIAGYRHSTDNDAERAAFELGRFARGRIDPALFALVFGEEKTVDPAAVEWIDQAEAALQEVASTTHLLQHTRVTPGGNLRLAVERALGKIGRAFGAVRVAEYARAGRTIGPEAQFLNAFPFSLWNKTERRMGLPLVVEVDGADLQVGGLEEFIDGTQKMVLIVKGQAPPAALVRLITPSVFVMQTTNVSDVAALAAATGPAVAALVPEGAAQFVYQNGTLEIKSDANDAQLRTLGKLSAFQQKEELLQLRALAKPATVSVNAPSAETASAPAPEDLLAGWLLRQADVA